MVPCVNWATDRPTSVESVNIELTSRSPNCVSAANAASRCSACVFMVSVVNRTLSASVMVRPGRWAYTTPVSNSSNHSPRWTIFRAVTGQTPSSRAISINWTSVVPSPISRILLSR